MDRYMPGILDMAEQAGKRTGDLAALAAWLLSFTPEEAVEELAFLYLTCRSYTRSALTIQGLDRLLARPNLDPKQVVGDTLLLAELVEWRLEHTPPDAAALQQLRESLPDTAAAEVDKAAPTPAAVAMAVASQDTARRAAGPRRPPLLRLAEQAAVEVSELAALVSWLSTFAPVTAVRELEALNAITGGYHAAVLAIQSLDALLSRPWRSPREHVRGDLSIVLMLIDYRITRGVAGRRRLEQVQEQILESQRLEIVAADRRRQMHDEEAAPTGVGGLGGLFPSHI